jgi:hypothetical protein
MSIVFAVLQRKIVVFYPNACALALAAQKK